MIKVVILDLDGTLVDTSTLETLRAEHRWREIRGHINSCKVYKEVLGIINTVRSMGMRVAVFTNSPSNYVSDILKHFEIKIDYIVAYHDVKHHKPSSEGVHKVLSYFNVQSSEAIYLGDSDLDKIAAESAGVEFFSVEWGSALNIDEEHVGVERLSERLGYGLLNETENGIRSELLRDANHIYLGYYLDGIKQEVWSFKNGNAPSIMRWVKKTIELSGFFPEINVVVRALGHAELKAAGKTKPLDVLAVELANALKAEYAPSLIEKNRELIKSTKSTARERFAQVHGTYFINKNNIRNVTGKFSILIVDDVYTTGATTREIVRAIAEAYPDVIVYIYTLVKTVFRASIENFSTEIQHNTQLFSDLYSQVGIVNNDKLLSSSSNSVMRFEKMISKSFSANYARTNHNFIYFNLRPYSIAAEPGSTRMFSAIQILKNILQRGKPTIASRCLRQLFRMELTDSGINTDTLALISNKPVVWSRLIRGDQASDNFPAKRFFDELLPKYLGEYAFVKQLIVPEVKIFDLTQVYVDQLYNRQVDFFIPQVGLIIEIDGCQHNNSKAVDEARDAFTETLGLRTIRFTTQEIASENYVFIKKMEWIREYIRWVDNLEQQGIRNPPNGINLRDYSSAFISNYNRDDVRLKLTSAIRFQLLLLELLERGELHLGKKEKILLVNRDGVKFSREAILDLNEMISNIFELNGINKCCFELEVTELGDLPDNRSEFDLTIDFSILERYDDSFQLNQDVIYSRTHYFDFYSYFTSKDVNTIESSVLLDYDFFRISCAEPVAYSLDLGPESKQRAALKYFLSNLFLPLLDGDVDFREGQVGVIGSALSRNGTIGLLPTGAGKSICYQLSAILQPGISFVVCPIKSLMYDQKTDLDSIGFTRSNYISSELSAEEKTRVQREFGRGKYFFVFISPERFQTSNFRNEMLAIGLNFGFSYAVIDEVHCLSEWGHDFRTSYLNLSNTINRFASGASYIGLTATASVNVLKDIQSEFNIPDDYVRTPLDFTRDELAFHVIDDCGMKSKTIVKIVSDMEKKWNDSTKGISKAGIVFTPTVNGEKGCYNLASVLSASTGTDVRYFSGSAPKYGALSDDEFEIYKRQAQEDYKLDKFRLLAATKAFGMGVNKGNIAYTIHFGIPSSMEALYQEAGRAGRNKALFKTCPADCYVLLTRENNKNALEKIWDPSTSVSDLKKYVKDLNKNSDINTNLFLLTSGLDTINDENKLIVSIYKFLVENKGNQSLLLTARQFGTNKQKLEKAVYRLSQLGIVLDWVIEDFVEGKLVVEFQLPSEIQLEESLEETIKKYEPGFKLNDVFENGGEYYKFICDKFISGSIAKPNFLFLVLLLWSYDHFVYNRRQSLKTVYEQCSDLASGVIGEIEFKARLESYFKFNESSRLLLNLAESSTNVGVWLSIFFEKNERSQEQEIISAATMSTLKEQLARFLESYKDNACLNYLSGIIRLASDQFDDADGEQRMASAIDKLIANDIESAKSLIKETLVLKQLFSLDARARYARLVHSRFSDMSMLELINEEFSDSFSSHTLLSSLSTRLTKLTKSYKGIKL